MRELAMMNATNSSSISIINSSWNGCVMKRATVLTANSNPVPTGAHDFDAVSAPQGGVADSYWAPTWPGVIYYRNSPASEYTTTGYAQPSTGFTACPPGMRSIITADVSSSMMLAWVGMYLSVLNAEGVTFHNIEPFWGARLASKRGIKGANVND